jgi:fermentation-respiration switch protein FrsA (DUF1100 family)
MMALVVTLLSGCSALSRNHEALLVLGDLAAGSEDSRLKRRTPEPVREDLRYSRDGRDQVADLYRPGEPSRGAMVLVHGLTRKGRRDPRLMELALTLARAGFTVMVPEIAGFRDFSFSTREAQGIADAIHHVTAGLAGSPPQTALAAISFAVGPALLAAMQEETSHRVSFVVAVGGYYDLTDVLRYVTTGVDPHGAGREAPPPQREARWAVLLSQLHWLDDDQDRVLLETIARSRIEDPHAEVADAVQRLGSQGRALHDLVTNPDPDRVAELIARLPSGLLREFQALDLSSRDLDRLQAELVLIHGPKDAVIPISHSRRLRAALREGQARLFEAGGLEHVEVSSGWLEGWKLWRAVTHVLRLGEQNPRFTLESQ